jgi:TPR repeat protein
MLRRGQGCTQDETLANKFFVKACNKGYQPACLQLIPGYLAERVASITLPDREVKPSKAEKAYAIGRHYYDGEGKKNFPSAQKHFETACRGGIADGCYLAAIIKGARTKDSPGKRPDKSLLETACGKRSQEACTVYEIEYSTQTPGKKK